jgi:hypothetical protein
MRLDTAQRAGEADRGRTGGNGRGSRRERHAGLALVSTVAVGLVEEIVAAKWREKKARGLTLRRGRGVRLLRAGKRRSGSCHEPGARPPHPRAAPEARFFLEARCASSDVRLRCPFLPSCVYRFLPLFFSCETNYTRALVLVRPCLGLV